MNEGFVYRKLDSTIFAKNHHLSKSDCVVSMQENVNEAMGCSLFRCFI